MTCVKQKDCLAAASPKSNQEQLSQSARALRQAGASPKGKVRLPLGHPERALCPWRDNTSRYEERRRVLEA